MTLLDEIGINCGKFHKKIHRDMSVAFAKNAADHIFIASYTKIVGFEALDYGIREESSKESYRFFLEAYNDLLCSHFQATLGSFRMSLISLRNFIENILSFLYYNDHPVELQLWSQGLHRMKISSYFEYFSLSLKAKKTVSYDVLGILKKEYETLSRAVHASATSFRMASTESFPNIIGSSTVQTSKWDTRLRPTYTACMILVLIHFHSVFSSSRLPLQRKVFKEAIRVHPAIQACAELGINIT